MYVWVSQVRPLAIDIVFHLSCEAANIWFLQLGDEAVADEGGVAEDEGQAEAERCRWE